MSEKVIVVGGGIIGCSTAYYLASKGKKVVLIEGKEICAGTSSACDQAILLQTKTPGPLLELALESAKLYTSLSDELNDDIEYKKGGGMIVFETAEHKQMMESLVKKQQEFGLDVNIISAEDANKMQKGLSKDIIGATWGTQDAKVNSYKTTFAFAEAAKEFGAQIFTGQKVTELLVKNNQITGVKTEKTTFYADKVVLATGVWTPDLLEDFNIDIPIKPRRGQVLVTEKMPPMVEPNLLSASYIAAKKIGEESTQNTKAQELGVGLVMGQTKSRNILIGGSREFVGYNTEITQEVFEEIYQATVQVFPSFKNVNIIRGFAGLRPYTPDKLPIIDQVKTIEGLYVNAGHEGDGIALAPVSGMVMSEMISGEPLSVNITPMSLNRFIS